MADKRTGDHEFSPELLRAISPLVRQVEVDLPLLAGRDLAVLKQILRGEKEPGAPIDKKRAINALTRSERSVETAEILTGVLSNAEEPAEVRVTAARNITLMPPEVSEKALLRNLTGGDEFVREEVVRSLGRIGTAEGLGRLRELPVPENGNLQRQLSFAKLAIGIRSGAEKPDVGGVLGVRWTNHNVKAIEGQPVREDIGSIWGSTYGIALNPDIGFEVKCGRMRHLLFLNSEIKRGAFVSSVRSRAMIAGVVALREEEVKHSTIRFLLLTTPSETGVDVIVARTNGQVVYAGEAHSDGDVLRLAMRDVGLERSPTEIEGLVNNDSVQLSLRVWRGAAKLKRHGEPVQA